MQYIVSNHLFIFACFIVENLAKCYCTFSSLNGFLLTFLALNNNNNNNNSV